MRTKEEIRREIWEQMERTNVGAFPFPLKGRIPNFKGANEAAKQLFATNQWKKATVIKSNPDSAQKWVRKRALEEGKTVYMAVPRLRENKCFIKIQVEEKNAAKAATIRGAFHYGEQVHPRDMTQIDLVVAGSVAVNNQGQRIGKGGGYSDLELALGYEFNVIKDSPITTTVHEVQVLSEEFPQTKHDISLDYIFTPRKVIKCEKKRKEPKRIYWEELTREQMERIPILKELKEIR